MWEGSGRTLCAPSRFAHSAGDEGEDLLGKRDHNAARDGEHAVGALGGVVALEGQAQLEDAEAQQDEADGPDEGKMKSLRFVTTASGSSAAKAGQTVMIAISTKQESMA